MVRATIIFSAIFVLATSVIASPGLVKVNGGRHIGTGNVNLKNLGYKAVDVKNVRVNDAAQRINVGGGNRRGRRGGLLRGLLKREEAAGMKKMGKGSKAAKGAKGVKIAKGTKAPMDN